VTFGLFPKAQLDGYSAFLILGAVMRRREFIALAGGAAFLGPLTAQAQQNVLPVVGILMGYGQSDPEAQSRLKALVDGLRELGWHEGENCKIEIRWAEADVPRTQLLARELVSLQPKVILANTTPVTAALQNLTDIIPIVFAGVSDPVGEGFVKTLAKPGGNITGFINQEGAIVGKWLQLLKEIDPSLKKAAAIFNPETATGLASYFLPSFEAAAEASKISPVLVPVYSDADIEQKISSLGTGPEIGLVIIPDGGFMTVHRKVVVAQASRFKIPAASHLRIFSMDGLLLSYGPDYSDIFRRSASYVDRILKGATAMDLPVQVPTKFDLVFNLRTAKALDLAISPTLLARADEVIE